MRVRLATRTAIRNLRPAAEYHRNPNLISGVLIMKAILLAFALIAGLATIAAIVAPQVAYACQAGDPSCDP